MLLTFNLYFLTLINNIMGKYFEISTLGCKLNFAESSEITRQMQELGYEKITQGKMPDYIFINTCTVTELANKKSRQAINKLRNKYPNAKIIVAGCYSELKPKEVANIKGVNLILGVNNKYDLVKHIPNISNNTQIIRPTDKVFKPSYSFGDRTRSFFKVQDGCDYFCSYCAIPFARGRSRNNNVEKTIEKAKEVINKGAKELILTGVNIGDYGKSTGETFLELLTELDKLSGLERIRISSIEPNLLNNDVIELVSKSKIIVPHFHIPLQCGTDKLLKLMRRRYSTTLYRQRINKIKTLMPEACIAADVIIGVPGETEQEFEKTCEFLKSLDISYLHIFTYSERDNTPAVRMDGQVPMQERRKRSKIVKQISDNKQLEFYKQHLKTVRPVLFEAYIKNDVMFGFTDNYIKVEVPADKNLINKVVDVELLELSKNKHHLIGRICI